MTSTNEKAQKFCCCFDNEKGKRSLKKGGPLYLFFQFMNLVMIVQPTQTTFNLETSDSSPLFHLLCTSESF